MPLKPVYGNARDHGTGDPWLGGVEVNGAAPLARSPTFKARLLFQFHFCP